MILFQVNALLFYALFYSCHWSRVFSHSMSIQFLGCLFFPFSLSLDISTYQLPFQSLPVPIILFLWFFSPYLSHGVSIWAPVNPLLIFFSHEWFLLGPLFLCSLCPYLNPVFVLGSSSFQEFPVHMARSTVSMVFPSNDLLLFLFLMSVNPKLTSTIDPLPPLLCS